MADSRDLSRLHVVTLDAKNVKVLSQPRPDDEMPSNVFVIFNLITYLCIPRTGGANGAGTAFPGVNTCRLFVTNFPCIGTRIGRGPGRARRVSNPQPSEP